ncbi:343_t:CDS:2, partial [Diversispora eburnea]
QIFTHGIFRKILLFADNIYENMDKTKKERDILMSQLYKYRKRLAPFDIPFINNELPQVWWISIEDFFVKNEDHIYKLENMQKLVVFYISNIKKELPYYGSSKVTEELQKI